MIENQSKFQQTTLVSSFFVTSSYSGLVRSHDSANDSMKRAPSTAFSFEPFGAAVKSNDEKAKRQVQEKRLTSRGERFGFFASQRDISPLREKIRFFLAFPFFFDTFYYSTQV